MAAVGVQAVNGYAHYTTIAQGNTKIANAVAPTAGAGAFGQAGAVAGYEQYSFAQTTDEREFWFYAKFATPTSTSRCLFSLFDNDSVQIWADPQPDGSVRVYGGAWSPYGGGVFPGRGALLGTVSAASIQFGVQNGHKISVKHHPSAGSFKWVQNGITLLDLTNVSTVNPGYGGSPFRAPANNYSTNLIFNYSNLISGGAVDATISHVIIDDTIGGIIGQPRVGALFPNGAGNYAQWTTLVGAATHYQSVNETTPDDDTSYVATATVGHMDSYAMQDTPADTISINGLAVTIRLEKTDGNSRMVAAFLRIGGVDYVHATTKGVPGNYAYLQWIWSLSPATGVAFTVAEVNALEAGLKVIS